MNKEFTPHINQRLFTETIQKIQSSEGNDATVVNVIREHVQKYSKLSFQEGFLRVCNAYKIEFTTSVECSQNHCIYKVTIEVNGRQLSTMTYQNKNQDISAELATNLFDALAVQIKNEAFINDLNS